MMLQIFKDVKDKNNFKEIVSNPEHFYKVDDNFIWNYDHKY